MKEREGRSWLRFFLPFCLFCFPPWSGYFLLLISLFLVFLCPFFLLFLLLSYHCCNAANSTLNVSDGLFRLFVPFFFFSFLSVFLFFHLFLFFFPIVVVPLLESASLCGFLCVFFLVLPFFVLSFAYFLYTIVAVQLTRLWRSQRDSILFFLKDFLLIF